YDANPLSMWAAVVLLAGCAGCRLLLLGGMGERRVWAEEGHRQVARYAAGRVDGLYAVGPLMAHAVAAFGEGGTHFTDQHGLIDALRQEATGETTLLIKGSRSAAMDKVVAAMCEPGENP